MINHKPHKLTRFISTIAILGLILAVFSSYLPSRVSYANEAEVQRLNAEIAQKRDQMVGLDAEIARQRAALNAVAGQSQSLQNAVKQLEATRTKLEQDIRRTQTDIERAELTIRRLNLEISDTDRLVQKNSEALAETMRRMNLMEQTSLIERMLGFESMSDFWIDFELTKTLQKRLHEEVTDLIELGGSLRDMEMEQKTEMDHLAKQVTILAGETDVVRSTTAEREELLRKTRNEEAEYQRLLNQKLAEQKAFENELQEIESKLNFLIDKDSYPSPRVGLLGKPLDFLGVTQLFGGTQFAKDNPQIYGRSYHPGVDFRASIGTHIKSVDDGTIRAFDNTDNYPGCYAWGGWILVDHDNGLSSLYSHLSKILVSQGQRVKRGEVIALSGNTGISTGPHLHLGLYATQGVKVGAYGTYRSGGSGCAATSATGPFADPEAYLDPMLYLPPADIIY